MTIKAPPVFSAAKNFAQICQLTIITIAAAFLMKLQTDVPTVTQSFNQKTPAIFHRWVTMKRLG
jgi:hypothetical protein